MSTTSKPLARVSLFPISASIWENERDGRAFHSVTFQRSFRTEGGEWQYSDSFGLRDLLLLAKLADQAHSEIYRLRDADRDSQSSDE